MGIKKMFLRKEPTEAEIRNHLTHAGITTKGGSGREEKFGAFRQYAQERNTGKPGIAPVNPYASANMGDNGTNPYSQDQQAQGGNPYGGGADAGNPYGTQSQNSLPYGSGSSNGQNPYETATRSSQSPYGAPTARQNPYDAPKARQNQPSSRTNTSQGNPYASARTPGAGSAPSPYGRTTSRTRPADDEESLDLNRMPTNLDVGLTRLARRPQHDDESTLDLNEDPEDDLNLNLDELPEEEQVNSEDEEVESIKQDIRFVKQESLALTRNTLRMAQEADASGTNTLGMLGSQSERLYNAEQNLLLADTQTQIADAKVKELKRLNRSIFVPAYGNPFNKKSRLRQQEEQIKTSKAQEKYMRETNRQEMYASEQRLKQGITNNATNNETHQKYQGERDLAAARRYQFENDSEDDEMEKELAGNLDQIHLFAKKLKNTANTMGEEVDSQNVRLKKIEDDADRLDINVHMNNTRLANIR
ncbi:uncharacterized protein CANTADRAFT_6116 [Suhomyces tanzawaensis NRRL Y-17324]|uniref:t-SNARE coiled-coil homology domain-containing protein n=1 Tax=Suhomyces tanzawaensis NRRL Y-17324 TaxID=984487 RepID=A0A1E4SHC9_9ASCO|nr:uncharacterized protein CANTADRAFT_6116 [Suhomyces tanzawaensis NRRL Y-17324]ODV78914.1 hypothetical protein CANTADRAFT_6116 [Suhomyces tanzawaensis NRRL Y-17324]